LHSQGKHESSSHLYNAMCKYVQSRKLGWQQYTVQPTQTPRTKFCTLFLRGNRKTICIHQTMYWKASYMQKITFSLWKNKLHIKDRIFIHQSTVLTVKGVEIVSARMSHIVMWGCRWDLVLIVHAPTANINYDSKDNVYEEFEQVFDHFPTCHMQILLVWCKAKFGGEDTFKPIAGIYHIVWIHQTLQKMWEYKRTVHQLFIDFRKIYDLFRRKILNNILIQFGINMELLS
jgi:hypothetical protein